MSEPLPWRICAVIGLAAGLAQHLTFAVFDAVAERWSDSPAPSIDGIVPADARDWTDVALTCLAFTVGLRLTTAWLARRRAARGLSA